MSAATALSLFIFGACAPHQHKQIVSADEIRKAGESSTDGEALGRWLLSEFISPGGEAARADKARHALSKSSSKGFFASFARAIDADTHGLPTLAVESYVQALLAAKDSADANAPLYSWYASNRILQLHASAPKAWDTLSAQIDGLIAQPGSIGWRARSELVEWRASQRRRAGRTDVADEVASMHGCLREGRMAGPFGRGALSDRRKAFDAEKPGTWPLRFAPDPARPEVFPKVSKAESKSCELSSSSFGLDGMFYIESFFEMPDDREVILAVQGARSVFVDDVRVLDRDPRDWGVWPKFGVQLKLSKGRHRVVARLERASTSIRVIATDGTPLGIVSSADPGPGYFSGTPERIQDANQLSRFIKSADVVRPEDDLTTFVASYLFDIEGQSDAASLLMEPLVSGAKEAGYLSLSLQSDIVTSDPIFQPADAKDLARELHLRVIEQDPKAWRSRNWLAHDLAEKKGLREGVNELKKLVADFPQLPRLAGTLITAYSQLGWRAEYVETLLEAAKRFPDDADLMKEKALHLESQGKTEESDALLARFRTLRPDSDLFVDRALRRRNYKLAIEELKKLGERSKDKKDLTERIERVTMRAGLSHETFDQLEKAITKDPKAAPARFALADARFSQGDLGALRRALADAVAHDSYPADLVSAIELIEGRTELEPYRIDGRKVITEYEHSQTKMEAPAVRVLDYGVVWVRQDGSYRMLEHEIIRVQSQEAIGEMAEQKVPAGLLLRMRVIKKDGRLLEPEYVMGKPTLTMPHLEVGDYIETESITTSAAPNPRQPGYAGPHWFFREQGIAYWRSDFTVISPKNRELIVENVGSVPAAELKEEGSLAIRKWRVEQSPALIEEPASVPLTELLPSVRVGWGMNFERGLQILVDGFVDETASDPRLRRIAAHIVEGVPKSNVEERARRIYRWLLANVEPGPERDGRRVVTGKSGDLASAFIYLCRQVGIVVDIAVVRNKLTAPATGPISELASYHEAVLRVPTPGSPTWLTMGDKFIPFGYLRSDTRGQSGYLLVAGYPKVTTSTAGSFDGIIYEGSAQMRADGSATIELRERFVGESAIGLRRAIGQLDEARLRDIVESKVLGSELPGASLVKLVVEDKDNLDKPATFAMTVEMPDFARRRGASELVLSPPFIDKISDLAQLSSRTTTMLLRPLRTEVRFSIKLPPGAQVTSAPKPLELKDADRIVSVKDRVESGVLVLDRVIDIPAGRVSPEAYGAFQLFTRSADEATHHDIRFSVK